ncbi:MAG: HEAT repeat domain-containing protein [Cyclobacteriaceae bacterium]|nr:HEAT repeat domain-containing protein [Cyclobacteriaceae bacterium]
MNKEQWESRIIDYLDGQLSETEKAEVERELVSNDEFRKLHNQLSEVMQVMRNVPVLEPSGKLKVAFERALQSEIAAQTKTKTVFFSPVVYRIAAGFVLLMAGLGIGYWINKDQVQERELAELKEQVETNRRLMMAMLDNQQSASQRMVGVSVANELEQADDEIVKVLVKTMNEDANSNVRLAALEALGKFSNETQVRESLIQSLSIQKDPVVQIALIQLLVTMKEKGVVKQLEQMTKDARTMKAVKDEAYAGILKLS